LNAWPKLTYEGDAGIATRQYRYLTKTEVAHGCPANACCSRQDAPPDAMRHKRICELLESASPAEGLDFNNRVIYYVGPSIRERQVVGPAAHHRNAYG